MLHSLSTPRSHTRGDGSLLNVIKNDISSFLEFSFQKLRLLGTCDNLLLTLVNFFIKVCVFSYHSLLAWFYIVYSLPLCYNSKDSTHLIEFFTRKFSGDSTLGA